MFSVLIKIANRGGLLKPGMNAEVQIQIANREGVPAVPTAALRADTDVPLTAVMLGVDEAALRKELWPERRAGGRGGEERHLDRRPRDRAAGRRRCREGHGADAEAPKRPRAHGRGAHVDAHRVPAGRRRQFRRRRSAAAELGGGFAGGGGRLPGGGGGFFVGGATAAADAARACAQRRTICSAATTGSSRCAATRPCRSP